MHKDDVTKPALKPALLRPRRSVLAWAGGMGVALAAGLPRSGTALAADVYPDRPVRLVVPFAPGGAVDIVGRLTAKYLSDQFGQEVFVDNRSGAGGSIGSDFVAKAPPDGYTLLLHTVSSAVMNGLLYTHLPYDPIKDFTPITEIASSATLLVINAKVPATTLQQFVALVKRNPGKYNYGSTGVGSSIQLDGQLFATREGLQMVHVPYRGEGDAIKDLVAGVTQMEMGVASAFLPFIRAGKLRALCVNGSKRMALLPNVPTAAEAGLSNFDLPNWYALFGPRGLPDAIVQRIYQAVIKVLAIPEMRQRLTALGLDIVGSSPAAITKYWHEQIQFWEPVVKASGIKLDK
jgi:tripartite-type tricarboxylate transporter receptor subunit TctC